MFTYNRSKALGHLPMASLSVAPASISSHTSISEFFMRPGFCWFSRMRRLRRIGRPASCKMESCRVNVVSVLVLTPPMANERPFLAALSRLLLASFLTVILVTK